MEWNADIVKTLLAGVIMIFTALFDIGQKNGVRHSGFKANAVIRLIDKRNPFANGLFVMDVAFNFFASVEEVYAQHRIVFPFRTVETCSYGIPFHCLAVEVVFYICRKRSAWHAFFVWAPG